MPFVELTKGWLLSVLYKEKEFLYNLNFTSINKVLVFVEVPCSFAQRFRYLKFLYVLLILLWVHLCVISPFHLFICYDMNNILSFLIWLKKSTVTIIIHKIARKLLFVGIHPLFDAPHRFSFSSNYNEIHPWLVHAL